MGLITLPKSLKDFAFLLGVNIPKRLGVMHQRMHVLSKKVQSVTVTQQSKTRSIAESTNSIYVNCINRLRSGVEQQLQLLFGLPFQIQLSHPENSLLAPRPIELERCQNLRMHHFGRNRLSALANLEYQKGQRVYCFSLLGENLESLEHLYQLGQRVCLHLLHCAAAVNFYCIFGGSDLSRDLLVKHS